MSRSIAVTRTRLDELLAAEAECERLRAQAALDDKRIMKWINRTTAAEAEVDRLRLVERTYVQDEAEIARLTEADRLLRWYVEDNLVEAGDAFGGWDDDVREYVEVAKALAPKPKEPSE